MDYATNPIIELYKQTGVTAPNPTHPITPLGELIGSFNLMQVELAELTQKQVANYLMVNSSLSNRFDATDEEPLAGFLYATRNHAVLFVKQTDSVARRRFSAAHELGHYWLHYVLTLRNQVIEQLDEEPVVFVDTTSMQDVTEDETTLNIPKIERTPLYELREREADLFASRLLMPASLVRALVARYRSGFEGENLVRRLANELLVSQQAIRVRLRQLGLYVQEQNKGGKL